MPWGEVLQQAFRDLDRNEHRRDDDEQQPHGEEGDGDRRDDDLADVFPPRDAGLRRAHEAPHFYDMTPDLRTTPRRPRGTAERTRSSDTATAVHGRRIVD